MQDNTQDMIAPYVYQEDERIRNRDSTHEIVSKVAYLIGVYRWHFEQSDEPLRLDIYDELDLLKNARILRNLCMVRSAAERWFGKINEQIQKEFKSIYSVPEYMPQDALEQLRADGIYLSKRAGTQLVHLIIELNRYICDRVNNCKNLFPVWLNWNYIRDLFVMKNGLTERGAKEAADVYFKNMECYPYGIYINWKPNQCGNILFSDKKFVSLLYQTHKDRFTDFAKVSDIGDFVKENIYDFIGGANKVVMVVDCENSDPYRFCAVLNGLEAKALSKIHKIMLFDDVHTVNAWRILESCTSIPVEHIMTKRVKEEKSLVDIEMTALTCREHYRDQVDSFVIVSSDSEYWGLISTLPDARFLMMIEKEKCGPEMKAMLAKHGIFYCYIDSFYDGNCEIIKRRALFNEIYRILNKSVQLNVHEMFKEALNATRIQMKPAEQKQFFAKHISKMKLVINENGDVSIELDT